MSQRFHPTYQDPFSRPSGVIPAVAVSERVALSLRAVGAAGEAWLAGLPGLLAGLAADWSITVGARLDGGRTAYVAEATTHEGTPAVLKVSIPPGIDGVTPFDRQLAALRLAGGDPYVGLIRHDVPRQALLLERLGQPMAALDWPASRQLEALTRTAARGWRPVPDHGRLPGWAEAARWHAAFIPSMWDDLAHPCSEAAIDLAVRCAGAREAAFDPGRAVLVHGDVHAFNALQKPGPARADMGFRLVDPGGLISEPAHDLGVIQARGVQGWLDELAAGRPQQALHKVASSCRHASRITGVDPEAIWQWAYIEMVSTGLHVLRLGDHEEAETFLAVADKLAAATAKAKPNQARPGEPLTPPRVAGERRPTQQHHRPTPEPDGARPEPAKLLLMVGLPGAGKTTRAKELAAAHHALRLTPDEWMISLYDGSQPDGKRDLLEGRLIALALQALQLGTNVVLDFGLWGRDERSALRWLATSAGASCQVIYLPIDTDVQRARIAHRQATEPHTTFPMTEADIAKWRKQFQAPDATELRGGTIPGPPPGWPGWPEWAVDRWPSLSDSYAFQS
ncbi:AAA family ATPase [Dactylosporangium sp. CA-092794]|uniref:AAA family ATPase n=1 Tax=Dactylosporangium sp. CA-092794 TaxID=3239929 RepID=UPI003D90B9F2